MQHDEIIVDIWTSPAVAETSFLEFFFQLKSWQGFAYTGQGAGSFLPCGTVLM